MKKDIFIEKLISILWELDFSQDVKNEAVDYIFKNYSSIKEQSQLLKEENWNEYLLNLEPEVCLMILIYKIVHLEELYEEKGIPKTVMIDTLSDLTLRQNIYMNEHKRLGLNEEDTGWLKHIYSLNIFKLDSLQYELGKMSYNECGSLNIIDITQRVPEGSDILKVHIRRGVDLSRKAVDESFEFSKRFFKTYFPNYDYLGYTCSSWMLYSKNYMILPSTSNILDFANRFRFICESARIDQHMKYIFGRVYENLDDCPKDTSLQRSICENLENLGVGFGIIYK